MNDSSNSRTNLALGIGLASLQSINTTQITNNALWKALMLHYLEAESQGLSSSVKVCHAFVQGMAEPDVQGVQLHTHFLAPSYNKDQIFSKK